MSFIEAGALSSECVTNIRTVTSYSLQAKLGARFESALSAGTKAAYSTQLMAGFFFGSSQFLIFATYALCFWAGSKFIEEGCVRAPVRVCVLVCVCMYRVCACTPSVGVCVLVPCVCVPCLRAQVHFVQ